MEKKKNMRNEFEFMSAVLDALGVQYKEADIKVRERWRGKVLDGWGVSYIPDDLKQFERWRRKCIEGLSKNSGGGGSADITTAEATGTLANPWGDIDYADLRAKLASKDASAYLTIDATALGAGTINSRPSADSDSIYSNGATIGTTASNASAYGIEYSADGSLQEANMLDGGNIVDISSYASALTTSLYVIYHPLSI